MYGVRNMNTSSRRMTRAPIVFSKPQSASPTGQSVNKTKYALCFLCLFDGLRTPSIRRLVRKARTICQKPLVTFDPSCFAPSSITALQDVYKDTLNCPCEITVDPSIQTVLQQLRRFGTSMPPQRLLIHYYGQGSHIPDDGVVYFFSEDHTRYKPLKIANLLSNVSCPLSMIFECSKAAILLKHLEKYPDLFAFFSCGTDEFLPLSTDAEMDLFSSCLLSPFLTALRWHMQRHNNIYNHPLMPTEECLSFLKNFFHSILSAIFYDSQNYSLYQVYTRDPSVAALARGFVLAQRVMLYFNIHPVALPSLESMDNHPLWSFWDIALDCGITMEVEECSNMIYKLFVDSFNRYPNRSFFPIFAFFLKTQEFHQKAATVLLEFIDSYHKDLEATTSTSSNKDNINKDNDNKDSNNSVNESSNIFDNAASMASLSPIPYTIIDLSHPSPTSLIALSKMIACSKTSPFDQNSSLTFTASKDPEVLKAGMLSLCCTVATSTLVTFNRLTQMCIDHAIDCAPFSSLLLGSLIERAGRLLNLPFFGLKFIPLLENERVDIRASAAYLMGYSRDKNGLEPLVNCLKDESYVVRYQAALSLIELLGTNSDQKMTYLPKLSEFIETDKDVSEEDAETIRSYISDTLNGSNVDDNSSASSLTSNGKDTEIKTKLFDLLLQAVKMNNFRKKYDVNVFDITEI